MAWVTSTPELVTAVRSTKQFLTYVASGPFQYAVAQALALPDAYFDGFRADLGRKRDLLGAGLRAAGFQVYQPQGTYFITTDIAPLGEKDAHAFCRALPERCGVVAIPNSVFYDDPDAGCGAWRPERGGSRSADGRALTRDRSPFKIFTLLPHSAAHFRVRPGQAGEPRAEGGPRTAPGASAGPGAGAGGETWVYPDLSGRSPLPRVPPCCAPSRPRRPPSRTTPVP
ncbi:hypothetical protein GCM10011578_031790 [Streptomyces fuscichromogenes]|uniref:Aminotransferase class I/classII large domain-containing protein n=1 Tax=Streptomyces fuscichromogenes TaxID=1324013 RepID=A0A918CRI1_9ACTN|nr:hypothetical protein GCM10011578_031790 [Streptomyces fuscichromogenes]